MQGTDTKAALFVAYLFFTRSYVTETRKLRKMEFLLLCSQIFSAWIPSLIFFWISPKGNAIQERGSKCTLGAIFSYYSQAEICFHPRPNPSSAKKGPGETAEAVVNRLYQGHSPCWGTYLWCLTQPRVCVPMQGLNEESEESWFFCPEQFQAAWVHSTLCVGNLVPPKLPSAPFGETATNQSNISFHRALCHRECRDIFPSHSSAVFRFCSFSN